MCMGWIMTNLMLKQRVCAAIDEQANRIIDLGEDILLHPELGFKETYTSGKMRKMLEKQGVVDITACGVTGLKSWLFKKPGPCVAILGELDAVISPQHPMANPATGAAHACGHNAQLAALLGVAIGISAIKEYLSGGVCLIAAPAEEFIEIAWRSQLKEKKIIRYLGGKQQLIYEGIFDDIDMAMMVHSETDAPCDRIVVGGPAGGFIAKEVHFQGREAHAGGAPWDGINALNAAALAIMGIHANRETFREEDRVRIHPILTKGGDLVNTVPDDVRMESYVRAATILAMQSANRKVNRCIEGAAHMVGASAVIHEIPGYLPLRQDAALSHLFEENARHIAPRLSVEHGLTFCGSTDMGDLASLIPVIQPTITGFSGAAHSKDFRITDKQQAYLIPAKLMAATIVDLLMDGAAEANAIATAKMKKSREDYFALWDSVLASPYDAKMDS